MDLEAVPLALLPTQIINFVKLRSFGCLFERVIVSRGNVPGKIQTMRLCVAFLKTSSCRLSAEMIIHRDCIRNDAGGTSF